MKFFLLLLFALSSHATTITVNIKGSVKEVAKITSIVPGVEKIINSPEFRMKIMAATFTDTSDSQQLIYNTLTPPKWELFYEFKRQVNWRGRCPVRGWTYPNIKTVWFNTCGFWKREDSGIAGTICHEQAHKLGYGHRSKRSYLSVPYSFGTICAEMYEQL